MSLFFRSKTVLASLNLKLKDANNFRVYLPQFGDPMSEISDQYFQNCGNMRDILKKVVFDGCVETK